MLSQDYNNAFSKTVADFAKIIKDDKDYSSRNYNLFYPILGKDFMNDCELLVIGQATNGWQPKFSVNSVDENLNGLVKESIEYSQEEGEKCSLEWVNEFWTKYQLYRSFFWNITYKFVQKQYHKTDTD